MAEALTQVSLLTLVSPPVGAGYKLAAVLVLLATHGVYVAIALKVRRLVRAGDLSFARNDKREAFKEGVSQAELLAANTRRLLSRKAEVKRIGAKAAELHSSATVVQAAVRMHLKRRQYQREKFATIRLQALVRGFLARNRYRHDKIAPIRVQVRTCVASGSPSHAHPTLIPPSSHPPLRRLYAASWPVRTIGDRRLAPFVSRPTHAAFSPARACATHSSRLPRRRTWAHGTRRGRCVRRQSRRGRYATTSPSLPSSRLF